MRLYRLTIATIFQRKAWAICLLAVILLPFALPLISSATEKPSLVQPARILAAWNTLWCCTLLWGFFTAARQGEDNATSGMVHVSPNSALEIDSAPPLSTAAIRP